MSDKNEPTVQEQIDELNELMEWFEQDEVDIEESLKKFDQADALAKAIEKRLSSLDNDVTVLKERFDEV